MVEMYPNPRCKLGVCGLKKKGERKVGELGKAYGDCKVNMLSEGGGKQFPNPPAHNHT